MSQNTLEPPPLKTIPILDIPTTAQTFQQAVDTMIAWSADTTGRYVSTAPVYTIMKAKELPTAKSALENADMVCADGMPITWLQKRRGVSTAERVYGPDLMQAVLEKGIKNNLSHYLWGGDEAVPAKLQAVLEERYPTIQIAGAYSPPFESISTDVNMAYVEKINEAKPDVVWVGLGSPKQDVWMETYRRHLTAPLLIGVGAAFDFLAGTKPQAPRFMQRAGFEWLFRLASEPRRLANRYFKYNTLFILQVMRESLQS